MFLIARPKINTVANRKQNQNRKSIWKEKYRCENNKVSFFYLSGVARIKKQCCSLQTDPVTFPTSLSCQLHLMFLPEKPFFNAEKTCFSDSSGTVEGSTRSTLFCFIRRIVNTLGIIIFRHSRRQRHSIIVGDLGERKFSFWAVQHHSWKIKQFPPTIKYTVIKRGIHNLRYYIR